MFPLSKLAKMVFFDIETASQYREVASLDKRLQLQWQDWAEYLRGTLSVKYPNNKFLTDAELFTQKAALKPEFGRVVCISFGRIIIKNGNPTFSVTAFTDKDETTLLKRANEAITKIISSGGTLVGHNVKRFDIPYLCKRSLINGVTVPDALHMHDKKPWEIAVLDTMDIWSFGAWQEGFSSLDLICSVMNIESPKQKMKGEEVSAKYWSGEPDSLESIAEYNIEDVIALGRLMLKWSGLNSFKEESITRSIQ